MDNLYTTSKEDTFQQVVDSGPIKDRLDLMGIDASLLLVLDDSYRIKRVEHRYHKRFQLREKAFALIRSTSAEPLNIQNKSMGCIACAVFDARPTRLGKIENISMGGLMFQHIAGKKNLNKTIVLDILSADCGFYLADIPFKILDDVVLPEDIPGSTFEMRQVRLEFSNLSAYQQARLNKFILNHSTENNEISIKV
jgi:hypothetical protein